MVETGVEESCRGSSKVLEWRLSGGTEESDESFSKSIQCPIQDLNSATHE